MQFQKTSSQTIDLKFNKPGKILKEKCFLLLGYYLDCSHPIFFGRFLKTWNEEFFKSNFVICISIAVLQIYFLI